MRVKKFLFSHTVVQTLRDVMSKHRNKEFETGARLARELFDSAKCNVQGCFGFNIEVMTFKQRGFHDTRENGK